MAVEEWKKDIAKDYIKENILLKKELDAAQGSILSEINNIRNEINSLKNFSILGSEDAGEDSKNTGLEDDNILGLNSVMGILFNNQGNQRRETGYELKKSANLFLSEEDKKSLDLLYESLKKAKTEEELKKYLGKELDDLHSDVESNTNNSNSTSNTNNENLETKEYIDSFSTNENFIYGKCKEYGMTNADQIAYVLATVKGECGFKNIEERGGKNRSYGKKDPETGQCYYGRGYVQLTFRGNYKKFTDYIRNSGLSFKDNNGNNIPSEKLDLVKHPDTILESNDLAAYILITGMMKGSFTGKKLDDFIGNGKKDFYHARSIINGMSSSPKKYEKHANDYADKILYSSENSKINNKTDTSIEGSKELLAKNRNELGGIGSSIMYGIENDGNNSFKNMDGKISGTTTNKERFTKKGDELYYKGKELGQYCKDNGIKSFMFYFGGNEASHSKQEVDKAYKDIRKWGNYLQSKGIQPVLCTCIYEDIESHSVGHNRKEFPLPEYNEKIRNLGQKNNWPVIDFAKIDNNIPISGDKLHPSSQGYKVMREMIDNNLGKA